MAGPPLDLRRDWQELDAGVGGRVARAAARATDGAAGGGLVPTARLGLVWAAQVYTPSDVVRFAFYSRLA